MGVTAVTAITANPGFLPPLSEIQRPEFVEAAR